MSCNIYRNDSFSLLLGFSYEKLLKQNVSCSYKYICILKLFCQLQLYQASGNELAEVHKLYA